MIGKTSGLRRETTELHPQSINTTTPTPRLARLVGRLRIRKQPSNRLAWTSTIGGFGQRGFAEGGVVFAHGRQPAWHATDE